MPLSFPGGDPLDFSFSTPSSEGLETMSSDEESTSSTRNPSLGQFPALGRRKPTARTSTPDKSFSQNGGTALTAQMLSVLSSYRKSPRSTGAVRAGGSASSGVFRKPSVGGGSVGHDSIDGSDLCSRASVRTPMLNALMSRSFSPQRSMGGGGGMSSGDIFESDALGSGELMVSPTNQGLSSRHRFTAHKLPTIPKSRMPVACEPSGSFTPSSNHKAMSPVQAKKKEGQAKKQQQSEDNRKAKLLSFLGAATHEKGVVGS